MDTTLSAMPSSGLKVNVRSQRHWERKWGMFGILTFSYYKSVGWGKSGRETGCEKKTARMKENKKSITLRKRLQDLREIRWREESSVETAPRALSNRSRQPHPQYPLPPGLQKTNQNEGQPSSRQVGARSSRKEQHWLVGWPYSTPTSQQPCCPLSNSP